MSAVDNLARLGYDTGALKTSTFLNGVLGGLGAVQSQKAAQVKAASDAALKQAQADWYTGRNQTSTTNAQTRANASISAADARRMGMETVQVLKNDGTLGKAAYDRGTKTLLAVIDPDNAGAFSADVYDEAGNLVHKSLTAPEAGAAQPTGPVPPPLPAPNTVLGQPPAPALSAPDAPPAPEPPAVPLPQAPAGVAAPPPPIMPKAAAPRFAMPPNPLALPGALSNAAPMNSPQGQRMAAMFAQAPFKTLRETGPPGRYDYMPAPPAAPAAAPGIAPPMPPPAAPPMQVAQVPIAPPVAPQIAPAAAPVIPQAPPAGPYGGGNHFVVQPGIKQQTNADRVAATNTRTNYLVDSSKTKALIALDTLATKEGMDAQQYAVAIRQIDPELFRQMATTDALGRLVISVPVGQLSKSLIQRRNAQNQVETFLAPSVYAKNMGAADVSQSIVNTVNPARVGLMHAQQTLIPSTILQKISDAHKNDALTNLAAQRVEWNPKIWGSEIATREGRLNVQKIMAQGGLEKFLLIANQPILDPVTHQPIIDPATKKPITPATQAGPAYEALQKFADQINAMAPSDDPSTSP